MNFYFPFLDNAGFILLIPPILIFAWIVTSSTPWKRRSHLWKKLKQLLSAEDHHKP